MERLDLKLSTHFPKIELTDNCLFLGSCFSEEIGKRFQQNKLNTMINPFGVLFHPEAIVRLIHRAMNDLFFEASDFFEFQDYWFNYELGSSLARFTKEEAVNDANNKLLELKAFLLRCNRLFLTLGSSVERKFRGEVVASCHKQPQTLFKRSITSSREIVKKLKQCIGLIVKANPKIKVYLTISPVRHVKESLIDNQISKAELLIAAKHLTRLEANIEYLPIYEYVIDCLRDYSFFNDDFVHPNTKAVDEIWKKIKEGLITQNLIELICELEGLNRSLNHKPLFPRSSANKQFLNSILVVIDKIERKYIVDLSQEKEQVSTCLKNLV